jgi:ubiquinol-cytochrome c reductase iron-sulfur subunit
VTRHVPPAPDGPAIGRPDTTGPSEGPAIDPSRRARRAERVVLLAFGVTVLGGIGLLVLYAFGGQTQLEGILLALCLGGLGVGIAVWAQELMADEPVIEPRHPMGGGARSSEGVAAALLDEQGFSRRRVLQLALLGALGGLASALAVPVLSLGPAPGSALFRTPWSRGATVVGFDGNPVTAESIPAGGVVTVFPTGYAGNADAQALLINAGVDRLRLEGEAATRAPGGFVCYSKICTHAGCPVGLYRASQGELICPCHQSTFDVMRGAVPTFGPAARPLPQLPIRLEADGTFTALGDFPEPVGPSFWNRELGPVEPGSGAGTSDAKASP